MNKEIVDFLWVATRRDIITPGQCMVLRDLFTMVFDDSKGVRDCVDFVEEHRLIDDNKLEALRLQAEVGAQRVQVDQQDLVKDLEQVVRQITPEEAPWEPTPGLDWFCYLAVSNGLISQDMCLVVIADLEEAGDLLGFAQSLSNMGFCRDMSVLQKMVDESLEQWARGTTPPFSVLSTTAAR